MRRPSIGRGCYYGGMGHYNNHMPPPVENPGSLWGRGDKISREVNIYIPAIDNDVAFRRDQDARRGMPRPRPKVPNLRIR